MSMRLHAFAPDEYYHVYNRGNSKQVIFLDQADYRHLVQLLFVANGTNPYVFRDVTQYNLFTFNRGEPLVALGAYCLMPNHFHILLTPMSENGISKFMQKVATGYSMYFNKKYKRTGSLFEGKFKAQWANNDNHLKYLYAYIHLNPVKLIEPKWKEVGARDAVKSFDFAASFLHSSLADYLGSNRPQGAILNPAKFPAYFMNPRSIQTELFEWLHFEDGST